jgi:hypothetical protein
MQRHQGAHHPAAILSTRCISLLHPEIPFQSPRAQVSSPTVSHASSAHQPLLAPGRSSFDFSDADDAAGISLTFA